MLIDHHKTAAEDLANVPGCHFDTTRSGAVLAWQHFHPGAPVPEILLYVEDRDLWLWQLAHSREINAALGELKKDFAAWDHASENLHELPSARAIQTFSAPSRSLRNAMRSPSGEYFGWLSKARPVEMGFASPPSIGNV